MLFYYDDERELLSAEMRENIQKAACLAIARELEIEDAMELPLELGITVVDKEEIQQINAEYRGIDKVTDVLSFPQFESPEDLAEELADGEECKGDFTLMLGDVVLCYDRACEQAEEYGTGIEREIVYLATHSVLHLLGYDHMEEDEKNIMRTREEEIMDEIGIHRDNR